MTKDGRKPMSPGMKVVIVLGFVIFIIMMTKDIVLGVLAGLGR